MILDQPIDVNKVRAMSDEEKIQLARQAYAEFLSIAHEVSEKQKHILEQSLANLQNKKIDELRAYIQSQF